MKNKIKDLVMEIAMIRQAIQANDISFMRTSVIDNLQRTQNVNFGEKHKPGGALAERMTLLEGKVADI